MARSRAGSEMDGCRGGKERPLGSLEKFFKSPHQGFIREKAGLAVVIITDGFENEPNRDGLVVVPDDVIQAAGHKKEDMKVYSISVDSAYCKKAVRDRQSRLFPEGRFSHLVEELVDQTQGSKFSLCASSYTALAQTIAKDYWL